MPQIIAQGATWKYLVVDANDTVDRSAWSGATWQAAQGPFGNNAPENGLWPNGKSLWLRYDIDPSYRNLTYRLHVEDHATVYVNGTKVYTQKASGRGTANPDAVRVIPNDLLYTDRPNLLAIRGDDEDPPAGDTYLYVEVWSDSGWPQFAGAGSLSAQPIMVDDGTPGMGGAALTGAGSLTAAGYVLGAFTPLGGTGELAAGDVQLWFSPLMQLTVLDPDLLEAPTTVVVTLTNAAPDADVVFSIDGQIVDVQTTDSLGNLEPTSLPVDEDTRAGTHTITATQTNSQSASADFTLAFNPHPNPIEQPPDTAPVDVGANGRWVLQDLMPGGLGSYILPHNPTTMTPPHVSRVLTAEHTTAQTGQFHMFEAGPLPQQWEFSGYCGTQEFHDQLVAYGELNRRFYIIDHRGRAWKVTIVGVDLKARLRQFSIAAQALTDWGHDYTVTAVIYDQEWVTPA